MKNSIWKIILMIIPLAIFWGFNHQNIPLQFSLLLGILAFPYVLKTSEKKGGYRFAIIAVLFGTILVFFRSSSLFYFLAGCSLLFILEKGIGKLNLLPFFLLVIVSPIVSNIVYIWSFPIRLKLSEIAASLLQGTGMDIVANGNILLLNGNSFSVDPACIGLKMLVTSLVMGTIILAYFEKKSNNTFSFFKVSSYLLGILFGAIVANFIRLLTLVVFHILPENPLHDLIGLLSIIGYVLIPFYFIVKKLESNSFLEFEQPKINWDRKIHLTSYISFIILIALQLYTGRQFLSEPKEQTNLLVNINPEGFRREVTPKGVLKLQDDSALIYIKPPVKFFQGSHDPRFCWQGSGYTFSNVQLENHNGVDLYTAVLSKAEDIFYTAWWYENETEKTPHEWNWRWSSLQGNEGYFMININCETKAKLIELINRGNFLGN